MSDIDDQLNQAMLNQARLNQATLDQARLLISRLERLSADSHWARRASGCRGALLKFLDEAGELQKGQSQPVEDSTNTLDFERLHILTAKGFELLEKAAREIPDFDHFMLNNP
jgi:hypothetical protein